MPGSSPAVWARRAAEVVSFGQGQPLGQGVEHLAEFEAPQHLFQVGRDRVLDNGFGHFWVSCPAAPPSMTVSQGGVARRNSAGSRANRAEATPLAARGAGAGVFSVARSSMEAILA